MQYIISSVVVGVGRDLDRKIFEDRPDLAATVDSNEL